MAYPVNAVALLPTRRPSGHRK